ncbi:LPXTG cell wall anchor domain-containing protein, partial [Streptomyces sp. NPDC057305]|uniref:LPXTG cell wall anchor domain-containing protein n=2 Tax=unclassified Streptomyces TaxID=2593676 RepID=UPI00363C4718
DEGSEYKQDEGEKSWGGGGHEKPHGGMHTGGGGLSTPTTTAGGLAVLGVAGAGLYAVRRKKSVNGMA